MQRSVSTARRNPGQGPAYKPYLFLLPMVIFAVGFIYYPFVKTILDSFSVVNFKGEITGFAGLENYRYMISRREFAIAVQNTLKLMLINVPVTVVLTCCFAWKPSVSFWDRTRKPRPTRISSMPIPFPRSAAR